MFNSLTLWLFVVQNSVTSFITRLYRKIVDFVLHPLILFGSAAGLVSLIAWGPVRWFLFSFIPNDASGGWVAQLIITIVVGWLGGICAPIVILFLGLGVWSNMPRYKSY